MRFPKEIYEAIDNYIGDNGAIDSDKLTDFVASVVPIPDLNKLVRSYYKRIANCRIRLRKGSDGLRSFFSNGEKNNEEYVNFDNPTDYKNVCKARNYQYKRFIKEQMNVQKMDKVCIELEGQQTLYDKQKDQSSTNSQTAV